jgi:hypothetical protein
MSLPAFQLDCGTSGNAVPTLLLKCGTAGDAVPTLLRACAPPPPICQLGTQILATFSGILGCYSDDPGGGLVYGRDLVINGPATLVVNTSSNPVATSAVIGYYDLFFSGEFVQRQNLRAYLYCSENGTFEVKLSPGGSFVPAFTSGSVPVANWVGTHANTQACGVNIGFFYDGTVTLEPI